MAPTDLEMEPSAARSTGTPTAGHRLAAALLPFVLILAWTAAVRLPFYTQAGKDEFFFSVVGTLWLHGGLPYVASFDIKPPGLFFLFAAVQALFGASQATIKGMEIAAVAIAAWTLYAMLRRHGSERVARWVACLFPIYTVTLGGAIAANLLLQLPFLVAAFAAIVSATADEAAAGARLRNALLAGLAIGAAGSIKQTAVFEAAALFVVILVWGRQQRIVMAALYVVGAALPMLAFAGYFLAAGHFREMFDAVVMLARERTDGGMRAAYGSDLAGNFTVVGVVANALVESAPLIFLWGGIIFCVLRLSRVLEGFPARLLAIAALWSAAAYGGALAGLSLSGYYLLAAVPPLLILAGAFFCHGLDVAPRVISRYAAVSIVIAIVSVAYIDHRDLFTPSIILAEDHQATQEASAEIRALHPGPADRLLVLNRGLGIYTRSGLLPPVPAFHPLHLLGTLPTPVADPLGSALRADPRFIVIANPNVWHITERRSQIDRALAYVGEHYRVAATAAGPKDSFTVYEFVR